MEPGRSILHLAALSYCLHIRRELGDGHMFFLVNISDKGDLSLLWKKEKKYYWQVKHHLSGMIFIAP